MNPKQLMIAGTMAFAVTIRSVMGSEQPGERSVVSRPSRGMRCPRRNDLTHLLDVSPDQVRDRLYAGDSLADIASSQRADIEEVIDLQVREMTDLLEQRVRSGSLSPAAYRQQRSELRELLRQSAYRRMDGSPATEPQTAV
ncbi:hypothetical protein [Paenibacillus sp. 1P07SE]|uniref:hypothetical protein n=1 Tax=Paenibacillus sp. 1P07SE TaxID=3132209 RepID=UPI0039A70B54